MKQAAAIKRATQQARNAMRELDARTLQDLQLHYERAADDIRNRIFNSADGADVVQEHRLRELLQQIDDIVEHLGRQRDAVLRGAIAEAAGLGVRPLTAQGVLAVGGTEAVISGDTAARISRAAVEFVVQQRQADGLVLSERLWRLNQGAKEALHRAIASAVIRGASATRAAQDLMLRGQQVPGDMQQLQRGGLAGHVAKLADLLVSGDGAEVWKAERVMRTELNRAHGEAFMAGAIETRGFAGFRYLLSPAHPEPDICDLLAAQNLHGLGPGVYPTRELTPWPAHPNTLSFLEIVFQEEITDADRAGKETELQALQRLAPEIRAGVLGPTKAQYFDRGLLTKGMIRAKVSAVEARLTRQGRPANPPASAPVERVREFVQEAQVGKQDRRMVLGPAGAVAGEHGRRALGREVGPLPRTLEAANVRHALRQHGNEATERTRGQLAVTPADFELVQQIALAGKRTLVATTSRGSPVVEVRHVIGGVDYTLMEVVRKRDVTLGSMWKRKAADPKNKGPTGAT